MKSGNGIPSRCVYLEEMAADLEDQDWLDMNNVEQVCRKCWSHVLRGCLALCSGVAPISTGRNHAPVENKLWPPT